MTCCPGNIHGNAGTTWPRPLALNFTLKKKPEGQIWQRDKSKKKERTLFLMRIFQLNQRFVPSFFWEFSSYRHVLINNNLLGHFYDEGHASILPLATFSFPIFFPALRPRASGLREMSPNLPLSLTTQEFKRWKGPHFEEEGRPNQRPKFFHASQKPTCISDVFNLKREV